VAAKRTARDTAACESPCCSNPDADSLQAVLALVPDAAANRGFVQVARLGAFLDEQGATLPEDHRDVVWVDPVNAFSGTPLLRDVIAAADERTDPLADELGIELSQVRQVAVAGELPDATQLLTGAMDPDAVEEALGDDPFWSSREEVLQHDGEEYYSWGGDDEIQPEGRSPVRNLGIGGRLWVDDGAAAFTTNTATMEAFLDGCSGAAPTLADDADLLGIAERLEAFEGAFDATFTDRVRTGADLDAAAPPSGGAGDDAPTTLEGAVAYGFASGPSEDPEQARILLVVASETAEQAEANEGRLLERIDDDPSITGVPWSEQLRVERSGVDGRFLVVDLRADNASLLEAALFREDPLVISEP
jgi:hypothetical protein